MLYFLVGASTLVSLWGIGNLLTYGLQKHFLLQPDQLPETYTFSFPAKFEEVNLQAEDGALINGLHFRTDSAPSKGVILYCHGNAGDLSRWGDFHSEFLPLGYDLFIYDYRGYGKSRGDISEASYYSDTKLVYNHLRKEYEANEIVIYGRSLGSAMASYLASEVPCRQVILETPFASMKDLFHSYYPFLPPVFMFRFAFNNKAHLQKVDEPITIFQGTNDWIVPLECAEKLKPYLKENDEFITLEGGNHNNLSTFPKYTDKLRETLLQHATANSNDLHQVD